MIRLNRENITVKKEVQQTKPLNVNVSCLD
jgi:hypothetical protein